MKQRTNNKTRREGNALKWLHGVKGVGSLGRREWRSSGHCCRLSCRKNWVARNVGRGCLSLHWSDLNLVLVTIPPCFPQCLAWGPGSCVARVRENTKQHMHTRVPASVWIGVHITAQRKDRRSHYEAMFLLWALLPAFFPFFCFNTFACLRKSCQKLLPVYIVDLMFLIVLHRRDWILILGTWKWWDIHSMYSSSRVSRKHLLREVLSAQSSPREEPDSSLRVRPFPVLFGQAQRGEKTR